MLKPFIYNNQEFNAQRKVVKKGVLAVIVSNIKLPYAKLPKHLNSAVKNLFYPFSNEA